MLTAECTCDVTGHTELTEAQGSLESQVFPKVSRRTPDMREHRCGALLSLWLGKAEQLCEEIVATIAAVARVGDDRG